jgi:hypothetical protein
MPMRKTMSRAAGGLAALALAWALAAAVHAQQQPAPSQDEKLAASRALLNATGFAKQFDVVLPRITQQLAQIFAKQRPERAAEIVDVFSTLVERFSARKEELFEKFAKLYAERLPLEDMRELTRFYTSPVGARFIATMPELTKEAMQIGQAWGEGIGRELDEAARRELKKRGVDL